MEYNIALIKGDGIGPEIVNCAVRVLDKISEKYNHKFNFKEYLAGGCAIDEFGVSLPEETVKGCINSDSVLLGAVGGPKWDKLDNTDDRPEKALLGLRKALGVYTNLRPAKLNTALKDSCVLRKDIADEGFDILIVRELIGGIYFGKRDTYTKDNIECAYDTEEYNEAEIRRVAHIAFKSARKRNKHLTSIDKANVLDTSKLWRKVLLDVSKEYEDVKFDNMLVDNAAMQLIRQPSFFDTIVTSNMFGDILSDEASQITGSIGLLSSASLGDSNCGLYEPIHGSAPDIKGLGIANPIATINSAAMMLRYSFGLNEEADAIESSVENVLNNGYRTNDIFCNKKDEILVDTIKITDKILEQI